jgi:hypothetical protein
VPKLHPVDPEKSTSAALPFNTDSDIPQVSRVFVCASSSQRALALSKDLSWDPLYQTWYTHLEHPLLLQQLDAFGLRPCSPRTLVELNAAVVALSLGVRDPDLIVSLSSDHYVGQLRSKPISFFVSAVLYDPIYNVYLRTLMRHVRQAFNSSSAYEPRVVNRNLIQRFGFEDVPVAFPEQPDPPTTDEEAGTDSDDDRVDSNLAHDVAATLRDLEAQRRAPENDVASPPEYQVAQREEQPRRFIFKRGNDTAAVQTSSNREPDLHSPTTASVGLDDLRSLVVRLENRLETQTLTCSELTYEARRRTEQLMEQTVVAKCLLYSAASRANRTVQATLDASIRYRLRLERDVPEIAQLFAKMHEPPYLEALRRIADSEQWKRDDLHDEMCSALAIGRNGPEVNHTDSHPSAKAATHLGSTVRR